jgi:hypothetical protein
LLPAALRNNNILYGYKMRLSILLVALVAITIAAHRRPHAVINDDSDEDDAPQSRKRPHTVINDDSDEDDVPQSSKRKLDTTDDDESQSSEGEFDTTDDDESQSNEGESDTTDDDAPQSSKRRNTPLPIVCVLYNQK